MLRGDDSYRPVIRLSGSEDPVYLDSGRSSGMRGSRMMARSLILMVALPAVATYTGLLAWRAVNYDRRAEYHARHLDSDYSSLYDSAEMREWHRRMRRNYEFAASHPWLAVEPESPPPRAE